MFFFFNCQITAVLLIHLNIKIELTVGKADSLLKGLSYKKYVKNSFNDSLKMLTADPNYKEFLQKKRGNQSYNIQAREAGHEFKTLLLCWPVSRADIRQISIPEGDQNPPSNANSSNGSNFSSISILSSLPV
uniref:Uncharacterized protein n=1 Tax=Gouania willdenowi TaxID=441366 RepID=A0A8C5G3N2_GOUWI